MSFKPDKSAEKNDPLNNLGQKGGDGQALPDIYSLPSIVAYVNFKLTSTEEETRLLSKVEDDVRERYGSKQHHHMSTIIRSLSNNDIVGHSNFLRAKDEIIFGGIGNDNDFCTEIRDVDDDKI